MKFSNAAYYVWALVKKDKQRPGGNIESAYCTCTAGLLGCCNHVTAMLFRVEAAVSTGATKPSCTSILSKWNVPTGSKTVLVHKPIDEMVFTRSNYTGNNSKADKLKAFNVKYSEFQSYGIEQQQLIKDSGKTRQYLFENLKDFLVPRIMYVFSLPVFIAKAIGSFANLPCKREDCCLAVNSLECQTSILFIKNVIGQVISLQLAVLLISSHYQYH